MHYEMLKHSGDYPIIGVNTSPHGDPVPAQIEPALDRGEKTGPAGPGQQPTSRAAAGIRCCSD